MPLLILKNNQQYGPFEESVIAGWLMNGTCSPDDLAWRSGMPNWMPLRMIPLVQTRKEKSGAWGLINLLGFMIALPSLIAAIGGYWYISNHRITGYATQFGWQDSTYTMFNWMLILGILGFLLGIGLIVIGFIQKAR